MPSVVMNDGTHNFVIVRPISIPINAPISSVSTKEPATLSPAFIMSAALTQPMSAIILPLLRSISPLRIMNVAPRAVMPVTAI